MDLTHEAHEAQSTAAPEGPALAMRTLQTPARIRTSSVLRALRAFEIFVSNPLGVTALRTQRLGVSPVRGKRVRAETGERDPERNGGAAPLRDSRVRGYLRFRGSHNEAAQFRI